METLNSLSRSYKSPDLCCWEEGSLCLNETRVLFDTSGVESEIKGILNLLLSFSRFHFVFLCVTFRFVPQ